MNRASSDIYSTPHAVTLQSKVEAVNRWREQFNPLRGLTISKAVSFYEQIGRGDFADLMWTYYHIEETDPDLLALVERRTTAIEQLDWNIKVSEKKITSREMAVLADQQETALYKIYDNIGNLAQLFEHLALGPFRGLAFAQPQRDDEVNFESPNRFELLDPWLFARDGRFGDFHWNPEAQSTLTKTDATRIDPKHLIIRDCRRPINRYGLLKFIRSNLSEKDWDGFVEIFGIPHPIVVGPPNIPDSEREKFASAAATIAKGNSGYLPNQSDVKYPDSVRGTAPFKERLEYLSQKIILAGTGGMLTMLAESGSGTLAGGAHQETFEIIARADAKKISELLQFQFDRRFLRAKFPGQPVLAYFELAAKEEQDVGEVIDHGSKLVSMGLRIKKDDMEERTGYELEPYELPTVAAGSDRDLGFTMNTADGRTIRFMPVAPETRPGKTMNQADDRVTEAVAATLGARADLLKPWFEKLDALEKDDKLTPEQLVAALEDLANELPELLSKEHVEKQAEIISSMLEEKTAETLEDPES